MVYFAGVLAAVLIAIVVTELWYCALFGDDE